MTSARVPAVPRGPASSTRTVDRALDLLAEVGTNPGSGLSDYARAADLSASTALRLLRTLEAKGFLRRDGDGNFHAGPRFVQLGAVAFGRQSLVELAEPALQQLVEVCGESAYLSVRGPGETAVYLAMVEGTHPIRHTGWIGRTVQLRGTAIGQALRGRVPAAGYVAQHNQLEHDVTAIAAPIRRPSAAGAAGRGEGAVAAVLSVIGPSYRVGEARIRKLGPLVAAAASRLSDEVSAGVTSSQTEPTRQTRQTSTPRAASG